MDVGVLVTDGLGLFQSLQAIGGHLAAWGVGPGLLLVAGDRLPARRAIESDRAVGSHGTVVEWPADRPPRGDIISNDSGITMAFM